MNDADISAQLDNALMMQMRETDDEVCHFDTADIMLASCSSEQDRP